jgi:hypothetical protein
VTYGVAATVKDILVIASAETTFDAEIAACITSSDALVASGLNGSIVDSAKHHRCLKLFCSLDVP